LPPGDRESQQAPDDAWTSLTPWEKAAAWQASSPELADRIMDIAAETARYRLELEADEARYRISAARARLWLSTFLAVASSAFAAAGVFLAIKGFEGAGVTLGILNAAVVLLLGLGRVWGGSRPPIDVTPPSKNPTDGPRMRSDR
jgi:hypothetical protein